MIEITHQQAQRLLRSHLDARLPNEQWMMLQAHLETCETCRADNERLVGLEKTLKRSLRSGWDSTPGPAPDTEQWVLAGLARRVQLRKRLLMAGAAAALILGVVGMGGPAGISARLAAANPSQGRDSGSLAANGTPTVETPAVIYQPTVEPGQFAEVIAYEARRDGLPDGDREIYLLNPGSASDNLTNNPAADTDPAWSPDGEWLAFLSDREQKTEVYVTNITGNRVIQLTAEPGIAWQGPLSWSPDGKWISLSGTRTRQGDQQWIYLVGLDGGGARALAGTRGGVTPKFSPMGSQVAFRFNNGDFEGVIVQDLGTGDQRTAKWRENPLVPAPAPGSAFDWSADGSGLAFLSAMPNPVASSGQPPWDGPIPSGEPGSQVLAVRRTSSPNAPFRLFENNIQVDNSRWPGAFRGVTWAPDGAVVYLEDLDDARANDKPGTQPKGCWSVQVSSPNLNNQNANPSQVTGSQISFGGLCVEGGLDRSSWTADGRWVVVQGRLPSEDKRSIYALRMPGGTARSRRAPRATPTPTSGPAASGQTPNQAGLPETAAPGTILRLSDDPWAGPLPAPRPRQTTFRAPLQINPQPVRTARAKLAPSNLSEAKSSGQILYVVHNGTMSVLASANPDGTGGRVLLASPGQNRCPTASPDGNGIALVQSTSPDLPSSIGAGEAGLPIGSPQDASTGLEPSTSSPPGVENIFVLDPHTGRLRQVSRAEGIPINGLEPEQLSYGCPIWSPAGPSGERFLAALVSDGRRTFLAVLPASLPPADSTDPAPRPRYLPILGATDLSLTPVWSPDGGKIFLLHSETSGAPSGMTVVNVPLDAQAPLTSLARPASWQTQAVPGLAVLPDGKVLLHLEVYGPPGSAHIHRITFSPSGGANEVGPAVYLEHGQSPEPAQDLRILSGNLTWLYGSTFGVILRTGPQEAVKTRFYLYSMTGDLVDAVASFEDKVNDTAWSPDGRWLIFSAESGLWGVDILAAVQGQTGPVWLSPQPVQDLNWK